MFKIQFRQFTMLLKLLL